MSKEKLIDLEHEQLGLVKVIIRRHIPGKTVWAYGSRVTWKASDISDLDLAVFGCSSAEVGDLKEAFEESSLLVSVGVMDWESNPEKFAESVGQRYVVVQRGLERWREVRLEDVAEKIAMGPFGSNIKVETFKTKGIPIISGQHLHETRLRDNKFNFISEEHADKLRNSNVFRGDVIFTHRGNIGQVSFIPENSQFKRYVSSQSQFYLRCRKDKINYEFITYYFKSPYGQHQILANSSQTGVPSLAQPATFLKNLKITLPSLPEQKAIAEVLSSLDDKIDLLHRQNKTLENIARALFRKWFVEADEEREVGKLGDIIELRYGKGLKKSERTGKGFPVVGSSGIIDYHSDYLIKGPGIVIGRKGTLGETTYLWSNFYPIDTTYFVLPKSQSNGLYFEYFLLKKIDFANMNTDSAVPGLNKSIALRTEITIPKESERHKFNKEIEPFFNKIFFNQSQIKKLENLRDTLLPALINGKARFKNKISKNENPLLTIPSFVVPRDHHQNLSATIFRDLEKKTIPPILPSSIFQDIAERFRVDLAGVLGSDLAKMFRPDLTGVFVPDLEKVFRPDLTGVFVPDLEKVFRPDLTGVFVPDLEKVFRPDLTGVLGLDLEKVFRPDLTGVLGPDLAAYRTLPDLVERFRLSTVPSATLLESLMSTRESYSVLLQRLRIDTSNFPFNIDSSPVTENFKHHLPDDSSVNSNLTEDEQEELLSSIKKLDIDKKWLSIIERDFKQIPHMIHAPPLYRIVLYYRILETVLSALKCRHQELFSKAASTLGGKNRKSLGDVAHAVGLLKFDGKEFFNLLRYYRNHVHPDRQIRNNNFYPDETTAQLSEIFFKLVIKQITDLIRYYAK